MSQPLFIDRRKAGITVRDVFFAEDAGQLPPGNADLLYFLQSPQPTSNSTEFHTLLIDLRQDEVTLFSAIHKGARYEIRRARDRDGLQSVIRSPGVADLRRFLDFYDAFAASRGLSPANRGKLAALEAAGALEIAWVPEPGDTAKSWLCAHAYIVNGRRARLYHSASRAGETITADRQRIGRANRLLHWQALLHFRACGLPFYDMGGISMSAERKGIDDFKLSFGGEVKCEFNRFEATSLRGRLALILLGLKKLRVSRSGEPPSIE